MALTAYSKVALTHAVVTTLCAVAALGLNWFFWTMEPNADFDTLGNRLIPFARFVVGPMVAVSVIGVALSPLTLRVLRLKKRALQS